MDLKLFKYCLGVCSNCVGFDVQPLCYVLTGATTRKKLKYLEFPTREARGQLDAAYLFFGHGQRL